MHADVIKKNLKKASMTRKQAAAKKPVKKNLAVKPKDQPVPPGTILPTRKVYYGGGD